MLYADVVHTHTKRQRYIEWPLPAALFYSHWHSQLHILYQGHLEQYADWMSQWCALWTTHSSHLLSLSSSSSTRLELYSISTTHTARPWLKSIINGFDVTWSIISTVCMLSLLSPASHTNRLLVTVCECFYMLGRVYHGALTYIASCSPLAHHCALYSKVNMCTGCVYLQNHSPSCFVVPSVRTEQSSKALRFLAPNAWNKLKSGRYLQACAT